jgi:glycosyltransferase involved in cell wall biosynthesis
MTFELSLCIPTMNRWNFLKESIPKYLDNKYIKEIVIVDETGEDYAHLLDFYKNEPKIRAFKNETRLGPFLNKLECMKKASYEWICLMDSDNFADLDYFDNFLYIPKKRHSTISYTARPSQNQDLITLPYRI